jgi:hypothetical protein
MAPEASLPDVVEAIATGLIDACPLPGWERIELRVIRWDADSFTSLLWARGGDRREDFPLPDPEHDRIEQLAVLAGGTSGACFTKMSLDVFADGRFDARYGFAPVTEEDEFRPDEELLDPRNWP